MSTASEPTGTLEAALACTDSRRAAASNSWAGAYSGAIGTIDEFAPGFSNAIIDK